MTENKRFTCHQRIASYTTGEDIDFDFLKELIEEQRQPRDLRILISDGNKFITYRECVDLLNNLTEENEQLKKENSVFEGKDAKHYQRWVNQIKKYVEETNTDFTYDEDFIIKIALSYTLQSLRNGESLKRFQWHYKNSLTREEIFDLLNKNKQYTIKHMIDDYIQDHTIKVDKLPLYGNDKLIYKLPNKLGYIYFEKKWECIGKLED